MRVSILKWSEASSFSGEKVRVVAKHGSMHSSNTVYITDFSGLRENNSRFLQE